MSIVISPQSRSLPPPRQWTGSAARPVRLLHAHRSGGASTSPSGDPEQRATPLAH